VTLKKARNRFGPTPEGGHHAQPHPPLHGDGYPDILNYAGSTVTAYSVDADGATSVIFKVDNISAYPEYADLDHDGTIDIVYAMGSAVMAPLRSRWGVLLSGSRGHHRGRARAVGASGGPGR
jgi:hypothetical protein